MATPTPSHPLQPGSASKKTTAAHASTPSHLGLSSPAPRSVPSPAATRKDHAGKTPRDHGTASSHGSKTVGGTPMVQNLSQTGVSLSPGGAMTSFGTPLNGLGVDLGGVTPGQLNMPTPLIGAVAMMPSLSGLSGMDMGISAKRNEDEERRMKMRKVLKTIGRPKGRVSEESIARISRRLGLQNDIDQEKLSQEERERKVGNRTIGIAGKTILIDLELKNHVAQNVSVMFSGESKTLEEQGAAAGKILLEDLHARNGLLLQTPLDAFTFHLNDLARIDRLSERVNCFDALSGLYSSLRKLYDLEKDAAKARLGGSGSITNSKRSLDQIAELDVMRRRSGKPSAHERGQIGVSIDYWTSTPRLAGPRADDDEPHRDTESQSSTATGPDMYSLRIDIEVSPAGLSPSVRVSDSWLPQTFDLPPIDSPGSIPWQDPPPTYIPQAGAQNINSMDLDETQNLPDLRFVAKLDPPIIVPLQIAANIFTALGSSQSAFPYASYQAMLLGTPPQDGVEPQISVIRDVLTAASESELEIKHLYSLDAPRLDYGFKLEKLPFAHPRQIVELLPVLRQWAYFGSLLRGALKPHPSEKLAPQGTPAANGGLRIADMSLNSDVDGSRSHHPDSEGLTINFSMLTTPQPSLSFALNGSGNEHKIDVQILPNAEIAVFDHLGDTIESTSQETTETTHLAKALAVCGDLGLWIEWMREKFSQA